MRLYGELREGAWTREWTMPGGEVVHRDALVAAARRGACRAIANLSNYAQMATLEINELHYGDNLEVMREKIPGEVADLVYLDPPFNSSRSYNLLFKQVKGDPSPARRWPPATRTARGASFTGSLLVLLTGPSVDLRQFLFPAPVDDAAEAQHLLPQAR